ncbi:uncharacterized protein LOC117122604 [Anneissia japonica]|uniref:uncharacterized protein LOC117122604 n=1 Tax=Anneissia japonica TaxID=1529436 RepID=UPI001425B449|nr:uncharacterized protein LOC117122604 [Anneissia japonica]
MTEPVEKSKTLQKAIASKDRSTVRRLAESLNIKYEQSVQTSEKHSRDLVTDIERKIGTSAIDAQDDDGKTALYRSAAEGHTRVCRILIESGANKDIQNVVSVML